MNDFLNKSSLPATAKLTSVEHSRDSAGLRYVYPVISRRAGGLSVGINLNVNNACNWRCVYCQVPGLVRGAAPHIDVDALEAELRRFLREVLQGDFMARRVDPDMRRLNDIALSGNGEPTSSKAFAQVVEVIARVRQETGVPGEVKTVLITNGSLMHQRVVQAGVARLARANGEVWFKLDRATAAGMRRTNGTRAGLERVRENLETSARLCPTWVQTCMFALDGLAPEEGEVQAYLDFLGKSIAVGTRLEGVLLYSLARPSHQPEAGRLQALPAEWLEALAGRIRSLGLAVKVTP